MFRNPEEPGSWPNGSPAPLLPVGLNSEGPFSLLSSAKGGLRLGLVEIKLVWLLSIP
jgi:hypothetical protein